MKAELKYLHSPDVANLEKYVPDSPDFFCILVQAMIGPLGDNGEESFNFLVCTPKWIDEEIAEKGFLFGTEYLVVKSYS